MNSQAKIVLWIGITLIIVQLARQWKTIKGFVFTAGPGSTPSASGVGPVSPGSTLCLLNPALCYLGSAGLLGTQQTATPHHAKAPVI